MPHHAPSEPAALDCQESENSVAAALQGNRVQRFPEDASERVHPDKLSPEPYSIPAFCGVSSPSCSNARSTLEMDATAEDSHTVSWPTIEEDLPDLNIESSSPPLQSEKENISGRRIVDISHFIHSIRELDRHECPHPEAGRFVYKCERVVGLWSEFTFACEKCHQVRTVTTDPIREPTPLQGKKELGINDSTVWGFMSIGGGHANLEEVLSGMGIPPMSKGAFCRREESLGMVIIFMLDIFNF